MLVKGGHKGDPTALGHISTKNINFNFFKDYE